MNEEEREIVKKFERLYLKDFNNEKITNEDRLSYIECALMTNLIEKTQKENEKYKRLAKINLKNAEEFKNNMCEHRCLLKSENEELQKENEELKATLRDTQNSWFEDTKKIEKLKAQNKELETQYLLQRDLINSNDYIAKKKIKDQLEHYQELQNNYIEKYDEISENIQSMINVLQVLLEEGGNK